MRQHRLLVMMVVLFVLVANRSWGNEDWAKINQQLDFGHNGTLDQIGIAAGLMNKYYSPFFSLSDFEQLAKKRPVTLADLGLKIDSEGEIRSTVPGFKFDSVTYDYDILTVGGTRTSLALSDIDPAKFGLKKPASSENLATASVGSPSVSAPATMPRATTPPDAEIGYMQIKKFPKTSLVRSSTDLLVGVDGKSQPAYLSYVKNDRNGSNQLLVQGILAADLGWEKQSEAYPVALGNFGLDSFDILPSISFDKATNQSNAANDVDSLIYRLGSQSLWVKHPSPSAMGDFGVVVSGDAAYATDFEMREEIPTAEFDILPISHGWCMGSFQGGSPLILFRWAPDLHLEGGDVVDRGDNTKLKDNAAYLRGGPKLALTFVPYGSNPVTDLGVFTFRPSDIQFDASYLYYAHAAGSIQGNAHLLQASSTWRIGGSKNASLVITYQNGITALQLQSAHYLSIGLGLRF